MDRADIIFNTLKQFLDRGFCIFPLQPNTKRPYPGHNWLTHYFKAGHEESIWKLLDSDRFQGCNWAVHLRGSNLIVHDRDWKKEGYKDLYVDSNGTLTVSTPNGFHSYYTPRPGYKMHTYSKDCNDIKTGNGYCVIPPSMIDTETYKVMAWTDIKPCPLELYDMQPERAARKAQHIVKADNPEDIERAKRLALDFPPAIQGQHGTLQLYKFCCTLHDFGIHQTTAISEDILDTYNKRCQPPFSDRDVCRRLQNAYNSAKNSFGCESVTTYKDYEYGTGTME